MLALTLSPNRSEFVVRERAKRRRIKFKDGAAAAEGTRHESECKLQLLRTAGLASSQNVYSFTSRLQRVYSIM
jgi:hypothetical protein